MYSDSRCVLVLAEQNRGENAPSGLRIRPGDKLVKAELDSITGAEFSKLTRMYEGATVLDAHENTFGFSPHWYVEGA